MTGLSELTSITGCL